MFKQDGIVTKNMFEEKLPCIERRKKGAYIVMECYQKIPCNPCQTICPFHAVQKNKDINQLPVVNIDVCTGCGKCISVCPGMACFIIDETVANHKIHIKLPYEMIPIPQKGQIVKSGRTSCNRCNCCQYSKYSRYELYGSYYC